MSNNKSINELLNFSSSEYVSSISHIKIQEKNSYNSNQQGGNYSPTSSFNQQGGNLNNDINNLVNMLTSDSQMNSILDSNTSTPQLENKLKRLLNQEGGNINYNDNNSDINSVDNFIKNYSENNQTGGDLLSIGLAATAGYLAYNMYNNSNKQTVDLNLSEVPTESSVSSSMNLKPTRIMNTPVRSSINNNTPIRSSINSTRTPVSSRPNMSETTTDLPGLSGFSATSSNVNSLNSASNQVFSQTSTDQNYDQLGGNSPALVAFREIVKLVCKELDIKYNKALKIAGQVQSDVKEKNSSVTPKNLVELATKQLKDNKSKYQKMVA
jgi:hypothetical protein